MKKLYPYFCLVFILALVVPAYAGNLGKGNGAPSGPHYNLNIIGVPKDKSADMTDNSGHRIFVMLEGRKTKIMLSEGDEFRVLDANGTDGKAAFQLPNPDPENDGVTVYSVWLRALGKPGGLADITTCASDEIGDEYCSIWVLELNREKGASKFRDASKLLYVYADVDGDGTVERYPLFHEDLQDYFWDYDNKGLKLAQFRFYEMSTDVN